MHKRKGSHENLFFDEETMNPPALNLDEDQVPLIDKRRIQRELKGDEYWRKWNNTLLVVNLILLTGGLSIWGHILVLSKNLRCNITTSMNNFEPDCNDPPISLGQSNLLAVIFDSRVTFQPHSYMGGAPSNATNEMWQRLSPPGDGIVEIPNEFTSNLPASLPAPNNPETHKVYGVSVFHQLHCLNFLRFAYYPEAVTDIPIEEVAFHRDHCLDYIRQALMCAGDVTFEPLTQTGIDGMGAAHRCRDFEKLFSWTYKHRFDKEDGSGYTGGRVTKTPAHRNHFHEANQT